MNLDPLQIFIAGDGTETDAVMQALVTGSDVAAVRPVSLDGLPTTSRRITVRHDGFAPDTALLPPSARTFSGHQLLQEYFIMPEKFNFVSLQGVGAALADSDARLFDVVFGLEEPDERLAEAVRAESFRLHCVPIINLFKRRGDRISIQPGEALHHVVVDRTQPQSFEVYRVESVHSVRQGSAERTHYAPVFDSFDNEGDGQARDARSGYFSVRRTKRLVSGSRDRAYLGTDTHVALSGPDRGPASMDAQRLVISSICTNRGRPLELSNKSQYAIQTVAPVTKATPLVGPTPPRLPLAQDDAGWTLINALSLNHLSFSQDTASNAQWLSRTLGLFADPSNAVHRQITRAFGALTARPINRRIPGEGPITYGRGLEFTLGVDTDSLRGVGPFILSSVLERFFARAVSVNSFTETAMATADGLEIARWPARIGTRHVL